MELRTVEPLVLQDNATGSHARIAAYVGFNCYEFCAVVDGRPVAVLDAAADFASGNERPSGHGIPILFPYPNRVRGGRYRWGGREYELSPSRALFDPAGNAIHGLCIDRPWRVTASDNHYATGQFQLSRDAPDRLTCWPSDFLIEVRYELRRNALRGDVRIVNPDDKPLPWGFGTHPYFRVPLSADSQPKHCLVEVPAAEQWELTDCLPTGRRMPVSPEKDLREGGYVDALRLDDVLSGLIAKDGCVACLIMDEGAGLQVSQRCAPVFREIVVYTPPGRPAVCLEPYTCVTDAVNLQGEGIDAGLRVLEPGNEFQTWFEIRAGLVVA